MSTEAVRDAFSGSRTWHYVEHHKSNGLESNDLITFCGRTMKPMLSHGEAAYLPDDDSDFKVCKHCKNIKGRKEQLATAIRR